MDIVQFWVAATFSRKPIVTVFSMAIVKAIKTGSVTLPADFFIRNRIYKLRNRV